MKLNKALGSLFLLAILTFVSPVFAGGGPVEFSVEPNSSLNPGEQYVVHARVYADGPYPTYCKNCYIKLVFKNPQEGDYIAQDSEYTNNDGRIYAKVQSKVSGERIILVEQLRDQNGTKINAGSSVALKYMGESQFLKTPANLRISQIETTNDPNIRNVHIFWDPVPGVTSYIVYKPMGGINFYHTTVDTNLYEMKVNTNSTFYVAVSARKDGMESARSSVLTIDLAQEKISDSAPLGSIYIKVGTQKYLGGPKRQVTLTWGSVSNAVKYNVYARVTDMKDYGAAIEGTGSLSTQVGINAFLDYYVKVDACNSNGCISSSELFVPSMKKEEGGTIVVPSPSVVATPSTDNSDVEQLNKKVENLQNQLDQSKKTQSVLEQRINDLVNFIKKLFPFFK